MFTGDNLVIHTGTDERGNVDSVWVECPPDFTDADVQASVELTASKGCRNAKRAVAAMGGYPFIDILWPREASARVYRDGEI